MNSTRPSEKRPSGKSAGKYAGLPEHLVEALIQTARLRNLCAEHGADVVRAAVERVGLEDAQGLVWAHAEGMRR